jgi:hypothetical protein
MELKIEYVNGVMIIHTDCFLGMRNIAKFKKLLKIIETSNTPEARDVLKNYITSYLAEVDEKLKEYEKKISSSNVECMIASQELQRLVERRSNYRKNTDMYKKCDELVKKQRKDVAMWKTMFRQYKQRFKETQKNKEFYKKCLDLL